MGKHIRRDKPAGPRRASRVVAIGIEELEFLIVTKDGKTKLPGGREKRTDDQKVSDISDPGKRRDERARFAGQRELHEETGLGNDLPVSAFRRFYTDESSGYVTSWFVVLLPSIRDHEEYGDEWEEVGMISVDMLLDHESIRKHVYHFHADIILDNCVQMVLEDVVRTAKEERARAEERVAA